jgi:hypothetical protein
MYTIAGLKGEHNKPNKSRTTNNCLYGIMCRMAFRYLYLKLSSYIIHTL